jgi:hypothetical protein
MGLEALQEDYTLPWQTDWEVSYASEFGGRGSAARARIC